MDEDEGGTSPSRLDPKSRVRVMQMDRSKRIQGSKANLDRPS